jgi:hypothetical protein
VPAYNRGKLLIGQYHIAATSFVLEGILVTTNYTFNPDHNTVDDGTTDDPKSYEIGVAGYARQTLVNKSLFEDDTLEFVGLDADNLTYTTLGAGATIGGIVLSRYSSSGGTTSDTGQDLLCYSSLTATPTNGGDIGITWPSTSAGAILKIASTS